MRYQLAGKTLTSVLGIRVRSARDSQRGRVYQAEWAHPRYPTISYDASGRRRVVAADLFPSYETAQAFIDRVLRSAWCRKRYGMQTVRVVFRRGSAGARPGLIRCSPRLLVPLVLLHELAHCLTPGEQHGRVFARTYLALVTRFMGAEAGQALRTQFKRFRVRYRLPRTLTEAQRQACAARLKPWRRGTRVRRFVLDGEI